MLGSYGIHLLLGEVVLVGGWAEGFPLVFAGLTPFKCGQQKMATK